MAQWVQKLSVACLVIVLLTKTCTSCRRFVASIEIDADYTDADSNLQSPRMTDLVEELNRLFGQLEGFLKLELESVGPTNCNLVARAIVTVTSNVSVDDVNNLLETLQCSPVTIGGEIYSIYNAVYSTVETETCLSCGQHATCEQQQCVCPPGTKGDPYLYCGPQELSLCVVGGDPQLLTFDGGQGYVPSPCSYTAAALSRGRFSNCRVTISVANSREPIGGRYFVKAVNVIVSSETGASPSYYDTNDEAICSAGQDPQAEVWTLSDGPYRSDILTSYDPVTRTALLTIPHCYITVAFTVADVSLDQPQARYQGVSIVVPPDQIDYRYGEMLCRANTGGPNSSYPPWFHPLRIVLRQNILGFHQFPGACCNEVCNEAAILMLSGGNTLEDLAICGPILAKPSLASCLPAPLIDTFIACFRYVCQNSVDACNQLQTLANGSCPELATNLTLNC